MAETDNKVESLSVLHLQDVRRRLDQLHELALRHIDRLGRVERDLNEVKSDIILLENRSLSAGTDLIGLNRKLDDAAGKTTEKDQRLTRIEAKLDAVTNMLSQAAASKE
jgi:hypothetical protein